MYATGFAIAGIPLTQPIMPEAVITLGCVPIAEYGTPSTEEIPNAVSKYLQSFDAVLLENHGALTYAEDLLAAYHKMESVEFYAQLMYQSRMLGGPKELSEAQVQRLYEIRRQFGLKGKHPADMCVNAKAGKPSCHGCRTNTCENVCGGGAAASEDTIAEITRMVLEKLGK
jgi:L-fuculose-phosphate aldolase